MGIKRAMVVGVLSLLTGPVVPLHAQDNPDDVATQRSPEDRADPKDEEDPSDLDRSLVDPDIKNEPSDDDDQIHESDNTVRNPNLRRPRLGAPAQRNDSEDLVDDDENDPRDHARTPDRRGKKEPKKDAPKADAGKKTGPTKDNTKRPAGCVDVTTEARFASIGYDHIVTLKSECKKKLECQVRTNVTSEPVTVSLAPGAEESVVTWRGSPAREFTPDVTCK